MEKEKWFRMPLRVQLANVGGEVHRSIRWKNKKDSPKEKEFFDKAMKFLELTMADPKNKMHLEELQRRKFG